MSKASIEPNFRRLQKQWWWFDPRHEDHVADQVAWDWEILRRLPAFQRFQASAKRVPKPPPPEPVLPNIPLPQALAQIFGPFAEHREQVRSIAAKAPPFGDLDPRLSWSELSLTDDQCEWHLSWPRLSDTSRKLLRSKRTLFPRQHAPVHQYHPLLVTGVTLSRDALGKEVATSPFDDGIVIDSRVPQKPVIRLDPGPTTNPAIMGKHPGFRILPEGFERLGYIVILFDTRAGEAALQLLEEWKDNAFAISAEPPQIPKIDLIARPPDWRKLFKTQDEEMTKGSLKKSNVYPSCCQYIAQAWIPVEEYEEVRARFSTLLDPRHKPRWFARCKKAWSKPETVTRYGKPISLPSQPYEGTPDSLKAKSGALSLHIYRIGLPAFDWREAGGKVAQGSPLIPFFQSHRAKTDPDLIRDALKTVARRIDQLDSSYPP